MSDEEDYMSDKFTKSTSSGGSSLIQDRAKKRVVELESKRTESRKRQREEQSERTGVSSAHRLRESLKVPIPTNNKGFQLLSKMGFKPGQTLGKDSGSSSSTSLTEPIPITIKSDRGGLGREAALRDLAGKRQQLRADRLRQQLGDSLSADEFRRRATQRADDRFMQIALKKCQLSCENLDRECLVNEPDLPWFWPSRVIDTAEEESETTAGEPTSDVMQEDIYSDREKLEMLTNYLRTSYMFCFWCGVRYEDKEDLDRNCPGLTKDDH